MFGARAEGDGSSIVVVQAAEGQAHETRRDPAVICEKVTCGARPEQPATLEIDACMTHAAIHEPDAGSAQWQQELCADLERHGFWLPSPGDGRLPSSPTDWQLVLAEVVRLHRFGRGRPQRPGTVDGARLGARMQRAQVQVNTTAPGETGLIEAALSRLAYGQTTLVNGNVTASNIRIDGVRVGFIGWDDARADAPEFDLAPLGVLRGQRARVAQAAVAARTISPWMRARITLQKLVRGVRRCP